MDVNQVGDDGLGSDAVRAPYVVTAASYQGASPVQGGGGDHQPVAEAGLPFLEVVHGNRFRSMAALMSMTCREICTSLALEPIVLVSRNISCVRNSSLRPELSARSMIVSN